MRHSLRNLAEALQAMGYHVVPDLLRRLNYCLQDNRKTSGGSDTPDVAHRPITSTRR